MEKEKSVDALNRLVVINNDRIEGYETALKETDENDLKTTFNEFLSTSRKCKQELVAEISKLGGEVETGTKTSGKFFRAWMDVKAALTARDRKAILSSCEFGEDNAKATYENVLTDEVENLSSDQTSMIRNQFNLIKADHDRVKSMRDSVVSH